MSLQTISKFILFGVLLVNRSLDWIFRNKLLAFYSVYLVSIFPLIKSVWHIEYKNISLLADMWDVCAAPKHKATFIVRRLPFSFPICFTGTWYALCCVNICRGRIYKLNTNIKISWLYVKSIVCEAQRCSLKTYWYIWRCVAAIF